MEFTKLSLLKLNNNLKEYGRHSYFELFMTID